jgi:hypothetical protein
VLEIKKILGVTMALMVAVVMGLPGTAHAAEDAYNWRTQYLHGIPQPGGTVSVVQRRIYLASGVYGWYVYVDPPARPLPNQCYNREIYLGAGWYTWTDILTPQDRYYNHISKLNPDNTDWNDAFISCNYQLHMGGYLDRYTWGSVLDPHF